MRRMIMCRKFFYLASFVLVISLVSSASATTFYAWLGEGGDGLWNNPLNWNPLGPPPHSSGGVGLTNQDWGSLITIPSGYTAACTFGDDFGMIFGPEWGMDLDIYGNLTYDWYIVPVSTDAGNPSVISMYGGASIFGAEGIALGDSWWWHGGPYATLNMYDNSMVDINYMFWGGKVNLRNNAILDIGTGLTVDTYGPGEVSDATRLITIYDNAALILPLDTGGDTPVSYTDIVNDWIARGILKAGDPGYILNIDTTTNFGRTTVTEIVPEPATMALLGLGGLALIRRKRS
jgi:hypothetical protein